MTREEALKILGLSGELTNGEIDRAERDAVNEINRAIQKTPDSREGNKIKLLIARNHVHYAGATVRKPISGVVMGYDFDGYFDPYADVRVSIIAPVRGDADKFGRYLESAVISCSHPDKVEFLLKVDSDDDINGYTKILEASPFHFRVLTYPRFHGYWSCFMFFNDLSKFAKGDILWFQGDDLVVPDVDWYEILLGTRDAHFADNIYVVRISFEGRTRSGRAFTSNYTPAITREWLEVLGYVSPSPQVDAWLEQMANRIHRQVSVPMALQHSDKAIPKRGDKRLSQAQWKMKRRKAIGGHVERLLPIFEKAIECANKEGV